MSENKVQRGILYHTSGTTVYVRPLNGKKFELTELQKAVNGYIQSLVPNHEALLRHCRQMFCNEEALLHPGFTPNPHTWSVVHADTYRRSGYPPSWRVLGDIIAVVRVASDDPLWTDAKTIAEVSRG